MTFSSLELPNPALHRNRAGYCPPVSFIFRWFLRGFLWLLSHFPTLSLYFFSIFTALSRFVPSIRSGFLHFPRDFARFPLIVIMSSYSFIVCSNPSSSSVFNVFCPAFFYYMFPTIFTSFLHGSLPISSGFLLFHAFSMGFTRLLHFWTVLHHFLWLLSHFPALSLSNGFCTISSDRYHVFLQFLHPLRRFSVFIYSILI